MSKSCLVKVEVDLAVVSDIASVLGCQIGSLPIKYLGLQLGGRRRDIQSWNRVLELVQVRLESCQSRFLSLGLCGFDSISSQFHSDFSNVSECLTFGVQAEII